MASALDMSLDELIKSNKQTGGGRGGSRGGKVTNRRGATNNAATGGSNSGAVAGGAARRQTSRFRARPNPYANAKSIRRGSDATWEHDLFEDGGKGAVTVPGSRSSSAIETGTKLYVSNLDYGVSNDDIKELFSEVGDLKHCSIHYDRSGRSKGTAEVVFSRKADGIAALKRYNNVQLDGKPMNIALVGTNVQTGGVVQPRAAYGAWTGGRGRTVVMTGVSRGRGARAGNSSYRGRGRGRGRGNAAGRISIVRVADKTAEDLDAELETYHAEAMQTS